MDKTENRVLLFFQKLGFEVVNIPEKNKTKSCDLFIRNGSDKYLMFAKKLDLLIALERRKPFQVIGGVKHLKELNRIRNKLAHQLEFHVYHADLKKWACSVVGYTLKTINQKKTYRNTV